MKLINKRLMLLIIVLVMLLSGLSSVSASTQPAKIVSGFISSSLAKFVKWIWSLKSNTKTAISSRSMMKFESGYNVETVFDGSKLGIDPYSVEVLPNGELLILDSTNNNLYKISSSLSLYSRPKLVAGSAEGYGGHVDGKHREARMNHPKGVALDDKGNIYVADTSNMAIRKISDEGVTTIAGGKWGRGGGHVDGPSDEAKFSSDFDVVYVGSSCSLLVIDRGNRAIREIQLHFDDCAYQYETGFPLGIVVLLAAGFFGYMLALLQRRVGSIVSSQDDSKTESTSSSPYEKPLKSMRPPLIPTEYESEKQEEGSITSFVKLLVNASTSTMDIISNIIPTFMRKPTYNQYQNQPHFRPTNVRETQESFEIPKEEEPPLIETQAPTPKKTYAFMSKDAEKMQHQLRQSQVLYCGWDEELQQKKQKQKQKQKNQQHRYQQHSSITQTYYEQSCEKTDEIVFGAVQERKDEGVIRPTNYAMDSYDYQNNVRYRSGYTHHGYPYYT